MKIYNQMDRKTGYSLPKMMVFFVFLKRGLFNGSGWRIKWNRVFCWYGRHRFRYIQTIQRLDCLDCGEQIEIKSLSNLEELNKI